MKLVDCDPLWVVHDGATVGIAFTCPRHVGQGLGRCSWFEFENPIGEHAPLNTNRWKREGDTFETLTLTPSLLIFERGPNDERIEHWHGFIRNGEVIDA